MSLMIPHCFNLPMSLHLNIREILSNTFQSVIKTHLIELIGTLKSRQQTSVFSMNFQLIAFCRDFDKGENSTNWKKKTIYIFPIVRSVVIKKIFAHQLKRICCSLTNNDVSLFT